MTESTRLEPSIALAAYTEPLASNRRVLVFGSALGALSSQLLERGARSVHVCDVEPARVSEASARNRSAELSFSDLADSELSLRDGAFDLVLIENLLAFGPRGLLKTTRRVLAARGAAVVACPNPEAAFPLLPSAPQAESRLDYYALYDAVAAHFEHVRMLGQTPFVGYAVADFSAAGEPEPALDTSFVPGGAEEPDVFIALASPHEVRLDEFAVIQLPTRRLLGGSPARAEESLQTPGPEAIAELARQKKWIEELESRASTADERADHAESELEELRAELEREREKTASASSAHERESIERFAEVERLRAALAARGDEQQAKSELQAFEQQLAERGAELRRLEQELRTAERTGRELAREVERRQSERLQIGNAELARALAERDADLQAASWTIESLTLRLELAGQASGAPAGGETLPGGELPR